MLCYAHTSFWRKYLHISYIMLHTHTQIFPNGDFFFSFKVKVLHHWFFFSSKLNQMTILQSCLKSCLLYCYSYHYREIQHSQNIQILLGFHFLIEDLKKKLCHLKLSDKYIDWQLLTPTEG